MDILLWALALIVLFFAAVGFWFCSALAWEVIGDVIARRKRRTIH